MMPRMVMPRKVGSSWDRGRPGHPLAVEAATWPNRSPMGDAASTAAVPGRVDPTLGEHRRLPRVNLPFADMFSAGHGAAMAEDGIVLNATRMVLTKSEIAG